MRRPEYSFFVYILASQSRTLYVGVTGNLSARVMQHREQVAGSFTARYYIDRLVYFERFQYVRNAIAREKQLQDWNRMKKIALIEKEIRLGKIWPRIGSIGALTKKQIPPLRYGTTTKGGCTAKKRTPTLTG